MMSFSVLPSCHANQRPNKESFVSNGPPSVAVPVPDVRCLWFFVFFPSFWLYSLHTIDGQAAGMCRKETAIHRLFPSIPTQRWGTSGTRGTRIHTQLATHLVACRVTVKLTNVGCVSIDTIIICDRFCPARGIIYQNPIEDDENVRERVAHIHPLNPPRLASGQAREEMTRNHSIILMLSKRGEKRREMVEGIKRTSGATQKLPEINDLHSGPDCKVCLCEYVRLWGFVIGNSISTPRFLLCVLMETVSRTTRANRCYS